MRKMQKITIRHNDGCVVIRVPETQFDYWTYDRTGEPLCSAWVPVKGDFELDANENIWEEED